MRWRRLLCFAAIAVLATVGCTSEHGALPRATETPSPPPTTPTQLAEEALLQPTDVPSGYQPEDIDAAERWGEVLAVTSALTAIRPSCQDLLAQISATLSDVPSDSAGAAYSDEEQQTVRELTLRHPVDHIA